MSGKNTFAKDVLNQIIKLYTYKGVLSLNHADLQGHLVYDRIDNFVKSIHEHRGVDRSFDKSMSAFYYVDGSILVVNSNGSISASE